MAWIESHSILIEHPKLRQVAKILNISPVLLLGHLHCLWHKVIELREDGDITSWDANDISYYAKWEKDSKTFYNALKNRFIDEKNGLKLVHDWLDYAYKYLYSKYHTNNPKLLKTIRLKHKSKGYPKGYPKGMPKGHLPNQPNQPNLTKPIMWSQFPKDIQSLIEEYIEAAEKENKSGKILETKRLRLINELYNLSLQAEPVKFKQALEITVKNQAPNINYVKKVYKNIERKIQVGLQNKDEKGKKEWKDGVERREKDAKRTKDYIKSVEQRDPR